MCSALFLRQGPGPSVGGQGRRRGPAAKPVGQPGRGANGNRDPGAGTTVLDPGPRQARWSPPPGGGGPVSLAPPKSGLGHAGRALDPARPGASHRASQRADAVDTDAGPLDDPVQLYGEETGLLPSQPRTAKTNHDEANSRHNKTPHTAIPVGPESYNRSPATAPAGESNGRGRRPGAAPSTPGKKPYAGQLSRSSSHGGGGPRTGGPMAQPGQAQAGPGHSPGQGPHSLAPGPRGGPQANSRPPGHSRPRHSLPRHRAGPKLMRAKRRRARQMSRTGDDPSRGQRR